MIADRQGQNSTTGRIRVALVCAALTALLAAPSAVAGETESVSNSSSYDPTMSGHPVKIVYYALYPVGYVLDTLILRPAWWLGQREPFRTVFGIDARSPKS
jgi:hypothetical protein